MTNNGINQRQTSLYRRDYLTTNSIFSGGTNEINFSEIETPKIKKETLFSIRSTFYIAFPSLSLIVFISCCHYNQFLFEQKLKKYLKAQFRYDNV